MLNYIYDIEKRDNNSLKLFVEKNWKNEEGKNCVYITGLSGCGKSTLSNYLSDLKNNDCIVIHMDKFILNGKGDKFIENWYNGEGCIHKNTDWYNKEVYKTDVYFDFFIDFFNYMNRVISEDINTLYIVEGIQFFYKECIEEIKLNGLLFPIILLKENRIQMLKNLIDRNKNVMDSDDITNILNVFNNYLNWNSRNYDNYNELYNLIINKKGC